MRRTGLRPLTLRGLPHAHAEGLRLMLFVPRATVLGLLAGPCAGLYDPVRRIESARLYGNIDKYAYYYVDLLVGTPPQRASVILDTGSSLGAFPCASCTHCGQHIDPLFDFAKSSSARWVDCGNACDASCSKNHCKYHQGYQEGSAIDGYYFEDYVRLGDVNQKNPAVFARMGCHQSENKLFYTQQANGIFGIKGPRNILQTLFQDSAHVENRIFAICLAEWGGRLVVGGANRSYHTGPVQWTGLELSSYIVELSSMGIGRKTLSSSYGRTVIDSGTTYTYMSTASYNALRKGIEDYCDQHAGCGASRSGTCWNVDPHQGLKHFPVVNVYFSSANTTWEARAYLYLVHSSSLWCYSFKNDGANAGTVLGASWMQHKEVIFDLLNAKVGIAPANCPEFRERPMHSGDSAVLPVAMSTAASGGVALPASDKPSSEQIQQTVGTFWRSLGTTKQLLVVAVLVALNPACLVLGLGVASLRMKRKDVRQLALEEARAPGVPAMGQIGDCNADCAEPFLAT